MVQRKTKYLQDASEKYAVYLIEKLLEDKGRSIKKDSKIKYEAFVDYLTQREIQPSEVQDSEYLKNCERQLPNFVQMLCQKFKDEKFSVEDTERENRNRNNKADFDLIFSNGGRLEFSLKNYAGGIDRPQVRAGTFNSFVMNLLFDSHSVGMYTYKEGNQLISFRGSNLSSRNIALNAIGFKKIIEDMNELDSLHKMARDSVLDDPNYRMFDPQKWESLCKEIGIAGAETTLNICKKIGNSLISAKLLELSGLIGEGEALFISPDKYLDSITNLKFQKLKNDLNSGQVQFNFQRSGQSIQFNYLLDARKILKIDVPFTLNRNGAYWLDEPKYQGTKKVKDKKHWVELRWGERRPYKSRELATSINTYIDLKGTGVLD